MVFETEKGKIRIALARVSGVEACECKPYSRFKVELDDGSYFIALCDGLAEQDRIIDKIFHFMGKQKGK